MTGNNQHPGSGYQANSKALYIKHIRRPILLFAGKFIVFEFFVLMRASLRMPGFFKSFQEEAVDVLEGFFREMWRWLKYSPRIGIVNILGYLCIAITMAVTIIDCL